MTWPTEEQVNNALPQGSNVQKSRVRSVLHGLRAPKAENISDGTAVGRGLLTASDQEAARGLLGVPSGEQVTAGTAAFVNARGANLITNGDGSMGTNYNFPAFDIEPANTNSAPAAFRYDGFHRGTAFSTEDVPVRRDVVYRLSMDIHQSPGAHLFYGGISYRDADGLPIFTVYWLTVSGSNTVLSAPVDNGDMTVQVTDASAWKTAADAASSRYINVGNYADSRGRIDPDYSRTIQDYADVSGNQLILSESWSRGSFPAGTPVRNTRASNSYHYILYVTRYAVNEWHSLSGFFGGPAAVSEFTNYTVPPGAAYMRLMMLPSYSNRAAGFYDDPINPDQKLIVANVRLQEVKPSRIGGDGRRWVLTAPTDADAAPLNAQWINV